MFFASGAFARTPEEEDMKGITKQALIKSLEEVIAEESKSDSTLVLSNYCGCVKQCLEEGGCETLILELSRDFLVILKSQNVLFPSDLRNSVHRKTNALLTSRDWDLKMKEILAAIKRAPDSVLCAFVGHVCFKVFVWQLALCLKRLRGHASSDMPSRNQFSSDALHPEQFHQLVYHIGGCVLHSLFKKSKLYSSNPDWVRYGEVVNKCFLIQTSSFETQNFSPQVTSFTAERNRGGLLFCCQEVFDFLCHCFKQFCRWKRKMALCPQTM